MKKYLITGSSGFLARYLASDIKCNCKADIYGLTDVKSEEKSADFAKEFICDIRDYNAVSGIINKVEPDILIHLAAVSSVGFSWKNSALTYEVNLIGTDNLLKAVKGLNKKVRVVLLSSAEVYGRNGEGRDISEDVEPDIRNPYALSKYAMELAADLCRADSDIEIIKLRAFPFTGPGQSSNFVSSSFARQIAEIERGLQDPVIHVGNLEPVRDFSDVRDIASYIRIITEKGESGDLFNLCSGHSVSIRELLDILLTLTDSDIEVRIDPERCRPADIRELRGSVQKLKERFKIKPEFSIHDTMESLLEFWRNNES